ncbi:MAG: NUDIX domain-containing protein [Halobacteriovoraceae bacterium]|nr:NUDIX domain-containing protein [Halobacteriovoraceae bacterium]
MQKLIGAIPFEDYDLGQERGEVTLSEHSGKWKECFLEVESFFKEFMAPIGLTLFHAGSTAVPGISAKPVLDIVAEANHFAELDAYQKIFEAAGIEYKGEYGIKDRRYCTVYNSDKTKGFVHLHIYPKGHYQIKTHLAFNNFLIKNRAVAKDYHELKNRLRDKYRDNREKYTNSKHSFIQEVLNRALERKIRPLALGIIKRADGKFLLDKGFDSVKNQWFYRPLGGGIEFGERGEEALRREFMEEIDKEVGETQIIDVYENIFEYEGKPGHETILLFSCSFMSDSDYDFEEIDIVEEGRVLSKATWKNLSEIEKEGSPLYPEGLMDRLKE